MKNTIEFLKTAELEPLAQARGLLYNDKIE